LPGACLVRFNLSTDEVGLSSLREWLAAPPAERRWYQVLSSAQPSAPTFLQNLRASGRINAERFMIHNQIAENVSASLDLNQGQLRISDLRGNIFGGKHRGDWQVDFTAASPVFTGSGTFSALSLQQISEAMDDSWISGNAAGTYQISATGSDATAFWQSADAKVQFDVRDGTLPHISLPTGEGPLHFARFQGHARLRDAEFEIEPAKLFSPTQAYEISGTASLGKKLDLKLARGSEMNPTHAGSLVYLITGTLAQPQISLTPTPETQAQLKP
jgi:hypothetical protein